MTDEEPEALASVPAPSRIEPGMIEEDASDVWRMVRSLAAVLADNDKDDGDMVVVLGCFLGFVCAGHPAAANLLDTIVEVARNFISDDPLDLRSHRTGPQA